MTNTQPILIVKLSWQSVNDFVQFPRCDQEGRETYGGNRKPVKRDMATDAGGGYRIQIAPSAVRQLRKLPASVQERIAGHIEELAIDPRPRGAIKLQGEDDLYRIRVGDYRVIYTIRDDELIVLVLRVGHRREIYRG
jgi:mRNA interferase RelE/StbE